MKDFKLCASNIASLAVEIGRMVATGKSWRVSIVEWREKRSLSSNNLYWMWLAEIDKQNPLTLVNSSYKGAELWHEVFKKYYCPPSIISNGDMEMEVVSTKMLDVAQMHHYLAQIEVWAMNRGFKLTIPINSEYQELIDRQNK